MNANSTQPLWASIVEDYRTHESDWHRPGFRAIACYRFGVWRMGVRIRPLRMFLSFVYKALYRHCAYVYGIEVPYTARIGRRVKFEHQHGIVIHGACVIGDDCVIRQGVTLGIKDEHFPNDAPRLGMRVSIGAGAKLMGAIRVGNDVRVGANAVVLQDVPSNCTVVGIPARVVSAATARACDVEMEASA